MKSSVNDTQSIAEIYSKRHLVVEAAAEEDQEKKTGIQNAIYDRVAGLFKTSDKRISKSEDGEYEDYESSNTSPVDQEDYCGYDQVSEPEVSEVSVVDESEMHVALSDLHKAGKYAAELTELLGRVGSLEGWTAVKIAKAADYLGAVYHQLDYDLNGHSMHNTGYEDAPAEDNQ
tara:strand:+ start:38 stop:559 length:522 start_codon:yes stop_codon:yes gene_type:complete